MIQSKVQPLDPNNLIEQKFDALLCTPHPHYCSSCRALRNRMQVSSVHLLHMQEPSIEKIIHHFKFQITQIAHVLQRIAIQKHYTSQQGCTLAESTARIIILMRQYQSIVSRSAAQILCSLIARIQRFHKGVAGLNSMSANPILEIIQQLQRHQLPREESVTSRL